MEAAIFKPKPQMRAAVRDGLNRFHLVNKMETDKTKGTAHLVRLALISRANLESVRRTARGIKFERKHGKWLLRLKLGVGRPKIAFLIDQTEMIAIIQLLDVPIHLKFGDPLSKLRDGVWKELHQIEGHVNALGVFRYFDSFDFGSFDFDSPEFSAFIGSVAPRLRVLHSTWDLLPRFPPLDLETARLYNTTDDYSELNRHKIRRLDVSLRDLPLYTTQSTQVVSASIKSLGLIVACVLDWSTLPYDSIEGFSRRFPSLEDLHIICKYYEEVPDLSAYFTALWAKYLEIRDRLHVGGLKRLFITIKHDCHFLGTPNDWFEKLKQVEPFHEATSTIDRSKKCVRMFLKHNEPRGQKPTFILIKGGFRWFSEEAASCLIVPVRKYPAVRRFCPLFVCPLATSRFQSELCELCSV
ncbi:hypothetical protein M3Y99_00455400 [Aphelenchoides fujianensis]|nr:hypothetical protein M3Y99_00455400 [Aphelenchoides fujianensis]